MIEQLSKAHNLHLLSGTKRGIERECLRITNNGNLAQTDHPYNLGATLTHPKITTDYAESLLEFITAAHPSTKQTLQELFDIHAITYQHLKDELIWSASMPCVLPLEEQIPLAQFGASNLGQLKHVYRLGLALRYGRTMQCIAGIHYNFSFNSELFTWLQNQQEATNADFKSQAYINAMRNFVRYSWVLLYLFGATPAVDASFLRNLKRPHPLQQLDDETFYLPYATSLRMSGLGYRSAAQASITPCYNHLDTYISSIKNAITTPFAPYAEYGTHDQNGNWQQLNCNILQIENEYYSSIRPKRIPNKGQTPLQALKQAGIEYLEVRCLDINPFLPLGIDEDEANFIEIFLTFCLLRKCAPFKPACCRISFNNFEQTANEGRNPNLKLKKDNQEILLKDWLQKIFTKLQPIAKALDGANDCANYSKALQAQILKLENPNLLPAAGVLAAMQTQKLTFKDLSLNLSKKHQTQILQHQITPAVKAQFADLALKSHAQKRQLEQNDKISFAQFVADYQAQFA